MTNERKSMMLDDELMEQVIGGARIRGGSKKKCAECGEATVNADDPHAGKLCDRCRRAKAQQQ